MPNFWDAFLTKTQKHGKNGARWICSQLCSTKGPLPWMTMQLGDGVGFIELSHRLAQASDFVCTVALKKVCQKRVCEAVACGICLGLKLEAMHVLHGLGLKSATGQVR